MATRRATRPSSMLGVLIGLVALGGCMLGGCAGRTGAAASRPDVAAPLAVHVDNRSRDYVDIYLIQGPREWHLGRLAPGATASLPLPELPPVGGAGLARLAVLAGTGRSLDASRDARVTSLEQPVAELSRLRWTFVQGQLQGL